MVIHFSKLFIGFSLTILMLSFTAVRLTAADWPQWRGPNRTGHATSKGLLKEWPKEGPPVRWQVDHVGIGYSSASIVGDRIYTQGDLNGVEHAICISVKDGRILWAVQPGPLAQMLASRIEKEVERLDKNKDGTIDELEALQGFGWRFNDYDHRTPSNKNTAAEFAANRSKNLFPLIDSDADKQISCAAQQG